MSDKTPPPKSTTPSSNTYSAQYNKKLMRLKADAKDEQEGLLFSSMLLDKDNTDKKSFETMQQTHNSQNQQMLFDQQQNKDEDNKVEAVNQSQAHSVESIQQAAKNSTVEFCQALQDNHQKHNFEIELPKVGRFSIGTDRAGNKLHFSVASKEKLACDWLTTHQSDIENNVGQDLQLDVSLGIEHVV